MSANTGSILKSGISNANVKLNKNTMHPIPPFNCDKLTLLLLHWRNVELSFELNFAKLINRKVKVFSGAWMTDLCTASIKAFICLVRRTKMSEFNRS